MNQDCDYLLKLMLVGDSGVGKTSILNRFYDDKVFGTSSKISKFIVYSYILIIHVMIQ